MSLHKHIRRAAALCVALAILPRGAPAQPAVVRLPVPYHAQIPAGDPNIPGNWPFAEPGNPAMPNGYCTVACIDMLFNFLESARHNNPPLPQREIAAVANTNDPIGGGTFRGTQLSDARRAVHFSSATPVWPSNPPAYVGGVNGPRGYSWRTAAPSGALHGMVGIDGSWAGRGWNQQQLRLLIAGGNPLIVNVPGPAWARHARPDPEDSDRDHNTSYTEVEATAVGHSVVLRGYDNVRSVYLFRDPTLGPAIQCDQQTFWDSVWTGSPFLLVEEWATSIQVPALGSIRPMGFATQATATYTDPLPAAGTGRQVQTKGSLFFLGANPVAARAQGQARTIGFDQVVLSGAWQQKSWQCVTIAYDTCQAAAETWGIVNAVAHSGAYTDHIGHADTTLVVVPRPVATIDPSVCRVPRGVHWWEGEHLSVAPDFAPGMPSGIEVEVENRGDVPATGVLVDVYIGEPSLAELCPDPDLMLVGTIPIGTIMPGARVIGPPVMFVPPPGNAFGQSYYTVVAQVHCPGDPQHDVWVELDNNVACRSVHRMRVNPGEWAEIGFFAVNPFPDSCVVKMQVETMLPPGWELEFWPAAVDSALMGPGERLPRMLRVHAATPGRAVCYVFGDAFSPAGDFKRRTGGLVFDVSSHVTDAWPATPDVLALEPPASNPVKVGTRLRFSLAEPAQALLAVYDVRGALVRRLFHGRAPAGVTEVAWPGTDARGARVAAGVYVMRLHVGQEQRSAKLLVMH